MKKTVLTFGVISGVIASVLLMAHLPFVERIGFDKGQILGYTALVLSFLLVFFGIRSYRDNVNGGHITFGKAFSVGILITLISCAFYIVTWQFLYYFVMPDFVDKLVNHMLEQARNSGGSPGEIATQTDRIRTLFEWYKNPLVNVAFTLIEPLSVGLPVTLISSAILRKKPAQSDTGHAVTAMT